MNMRKTREQKRVALESAVSAAQAALSARWPGKYQVLIRYSPRTVDRIIVQRHTESSDGKGGAVEIPPALS